MRAVVLVISLLVASLGADALRAQVVGEPDERVFSAIVTAAESLGVYSSSAELAASAALLEAEAGVDRVVLLEQLALFSEKYAESERRMFGALFLAEKLEFSYVERLAAALPLLEDTEWRSRFGRVLGAILGPAEGEGDGNGPNLQIHLGTLQSGGCGECEGLIDYMISRNRRWTVHALAEEYLDSACWHSCNALRP